MSEENAINSNEPTSQDKEEQVKKKISLDPSSLFSKLSMFKIPILVVIAVILAMSTALVISKATNSNAATEKENHAEESKKHEVGKYITIDTFTVNLSGGQNYLQAGVAFEIKSESTELENELKERKPQISDVIIAKLSSKSISDISNVSGKTKLKIEIKKAVDSLLSYGKIEHVYFTTFIMQ